MQIGISVLLYISVFLYVLRKGIVHTVKSLLLKLNQKSSTQREAQDAELSKTFIELSKD